MGAAQWRAVWADGCGNDGVGMASPGGLNTRKFCHIAVDVSVTWPAIGRDSQTRMGVMVSGRKKRQKRFDKTEQRDKSKIRVLGRGNRNQAGNHHEQVVI